MKPSNIIVHVQYIAASKPFKQELPPDTTVGAVKALVLTAFGLVEDSAKIYKLFHKKEELSNPARLLGEVAGNAASVAMQLEETLIQGCHV